MSCAMQVAGILVVNAHTVTDMSGEGFAVRLFRQGNQGGFVRAISDQPQSFAASFSKVLFACGANIYTKGMRPHLRGFLVGSERVALFSLQLRAAV